MFSSESVSNIKGVGEKTTKLLKKLSIETVKDLINYYPREYFVFDAPKPIARIVEGEVCAIEGYVNTKLEAKKNGNRVSLTTYVKDGSGVVKVMWFNQPYLSKVIRSGSIYVFRGKVVRRGNILVFEQPKYYLREDYRKFVNVLQPIYPLTEGLTNNSITKIISKALIEIEDNIDYIPRKLTKRLGLIKREDAISEIHFPKSIETMVDARNRLAFDEFFLFLYALRKNKLSREVIHNDFKIAWDKKCDELIESLPYKLTNAQIRVIEEVKKDLETDIPSCRLIQGDVGSGKTIIAIVALFMCALSGYQGCIMAPTEVLAIQHYKSISALLEKYGICVSLLVGSQTAGERKASLEEIASGKAKIIVGTHALIEKKVEYKNLALVITDEQHRFGVNQREELSKKGSYPHTLYMTATPIPRTLAMLLYGDMNMSVIDEVPADRLRIKNCVVNDNYRPKAIEFIKNQVNEGRQVYVICPMVEESENIDANNVTDYTKMLKENLPSNFVLECLHGKMKPQLKNDIMTRFEKGEINVLVSTTVIEVGINVPNATVMLVENAERFGLSQLHQLRGRVGRGKYQSYCIFMAGNSSKQIMDRLNVMQNTNDGFEIANADLENRGPGDLLGVRQSGDMAFMVADIYRDCKVLEKAKEAIDTLTKSELEELNLNLSNIQENVFRHANTL